MLLGIGIIKSALLAPTDGSSTQRKYVSQFLTIVIVTMLQVLALLVSMVMLLVKVNANSQTIFARLLTLLVVLHATMDMFFTKTTVCHYQALPILFFTTLPAALKSSPNSKLKEDYERLKILILYIYFYYCKIYLLIN